MCEGSGNDRSRWSRLYCESGSGQLHFNVVSRHSSSPWMGRGPMGTPCGHDLAICVARALGLGIRGCWLLLAWSRGLTCGELRCGWRFGLRFWRGRSFRPSVDGSARRFRDHGLRFGSRCGDISGRRRGICRGQPDPASGRRARIRLVLPRRTVYGGGALLFFVAQTQRH